MSEEWYPGQAYVHKHNANIRRAEERVMARNQDYKTDLYADLRDFDKAVEYVRACAIEGALDIALRDVLAANRAQASSEVREALAWALTKIEFPLVPDPSEEDRSWKGCPGCRVLWSRDMKHKTDCLYVNALALAPSRQGAGGK